MFTEDYQVDFLREHHHVFDDLRTTFLSGEMVWNFADFMTGQSKCSLVLTPILNPVHSQLDSKHHPPLPCAGTIRVDGNRKGLLTRTRQPKAAAHLTRRRYWSLIAEEQPSSFHSFNDVHQHDRSHHDIELL